VTSRTQASDVQWTFDAVRRLNDASKREGNLLPDRQYIEPGPLWWAFNPESAAVRGKFHTDVVRANDPAQGARSAHNAVVLIDEIDKAEPDVPNDLLEPFDRRTFTVRETGDPITANRTVLMVLTTNRERTLPRAFVRRCVTLDLEEPTATWLANIANRRYGESREHVEIAEEVMALRAAAKTTGIREPSTAEYLDAINACRVLTANRASTDWEEVKRALLWKSDAPLPTTKRSGVASD
jgi:MoxR-like ATPase